MGTRSQPFTPRQSMNNQQFEIFHYRANRQQNIPIHHHDFYEIYFFRSGCVEFLIEGRTYRLEPGDILFIAPPEFHQAIVDPAVTYERFVLWIDRGFLASLGGGALSGCFGGATAELLRPDTLHSAILQELLEKLHTEFYSPQPCSALCAQGLFLQLLAMLNRLALGTAPGGIAPEEPDLVSRVLAYIGAHFEEPITLEQLSADFFVSKYHLSREFRQRVGTTLYHYVICKRLLRARELMDQGCAPGAVFGRCGFGDYTSFYRAFRSEYGVSPRDYAPLLQKEADGGTL